MILVPVVAQGVLHYTGAYEKNLQQQRNYLMGSQVERRGKSFYWTDIRKMTGVKRKNLQMIIPYLMKYTDGDMVGQIMELIINE